MAPDSVVTRFAPSPTGHLHVGGARTALFCWAFARRHSGRFVLRIEDTDQARSSESSTKGILEDLAWLGIGWDEGPELELADGSAIGGDPRSVGPFYQAQRIDLYDQHIRTLIESGHAYPAFETPDELEAARREAIAAKSAYRYDRAALQIPADERIARMDAGEPHVVRFRAPDEPIVVADSVLGDVTIGPDELDDFIIRKRDGFPTYHFAVVVDDALMGVTHVLRGQEHLINTPRHVALQRALGFDTPAYAHMPLIFNPDGSKMSKRDKDKTAKAACKEQGIDVPPISGLSVDAFNGWLGDKTRQLPSDQLRSLATKLGIELPEIDVDDFRRAGYLPEALNNFLALLGWNPKQKTEDGKNLERFDNDFLAGHFGFEGIGRSNSKFDRAKLLSFNADWIAGLTDEAFLARWREWARRDDPELVSRLLDRLDGQTALAVAAAVKPRCKTLRDGRQVVGFALERDESVEFDGKAVHKALIKGGGGGLDVLRTMPDYVRTIDPFTSEAIDAAVERYANDHELGMGKVAQPLRVAATGTAVSPPLGITLALLGIDSVIARIERCIASAEQQLAES